MTLDVERFTFLLRQRPVCTQSPVKSSLGPDLHRDLRAKYKLELGLDLLDDRCPNSFNCIAYDSGCIGRPLPIDDSILQALNDINAVVTKGIFKGREVYLAQAQLCSGCPFSAACDNPCATQEAYLKRSTGPSMSPDYSMTVNFEEYEAGVYGDVEWANPHVQSDGLLDLDWMNETLPLDCLTETQQSVINKVMLEGKTYVQVGYELGVSKQAVEQSHSLAMARLEEFGKARKYIKLHGASDRIKMYYLNNMIESDIAKIEGVSQQAVNKTVTQWRKLWNLK